MSVYDRSPERAPRGTFWLPLILILAVGALLAWRFWPREHGPLLDPNATPRAVEARGDLAADEKSTIQIFREASPSVVHVTNLAMRYSGFNLNPKQIPQGTGTGFVWDREGHIVTNFHVIQGGDEARVTMADQSSYQARLVGAYPDTDLAVLQIDAPKDKLRPIPVGTSHDLNVGQKTFAIGNPFGLDQSLTSGIVSALGREMESVTRRPIKDMIQTDAAINPGNSGGPLLDSAGRLIGVNTAIYSPSGTFAGIGFAIPVDTVNRIAPQLIRTGKVTRPGLGVMVAPDQITRQLGVKGALIMEVQPDTPAAKAGLRPTRRDESHRIQLGDVIVGMDDKPVQSRKDLVDEIDRHKVGDTVKLKVLRDGNEVEVPVTLEDLPSGVKA